MSRVTNVRALDSTGAVVLDNGTGDYLTGPVPTLSTGGTPENGGPVTGQQYALSSNEVPDMGQMKLITFDGTYYQFRGP